MSYLNTKKYVFMISNKEELKSQIDLNSIVSQIKSLGGSVVELDKRNEDHVFFCTHVLCDSITSTVEIACALAAGNWLVPFEYVKKSYESKKFLNEEKFELTDRESVAMHRRLKKEQLYFFMSFYVDLGANTQNYKRILRAGGGRILRKKEIHSSKCNVFYAICDKQTMVEVRKIISKERHILSKDYIANTIFKKADARDFYPYVLSGPPKPSSEELAEQKKKMLGVTESGRKIKKWDKSKKPPNNQTIVEMFFKQEEKAKKNKMLFGSSVKKHKSDYSYDSSEIECLGEFSKLVTVSDPSNIETIDIDVDEQETVSVVSSSSKGIKNISYVDITSPIKGSKHRIKTEKKLNVLGTHTTEKKQEETTILATRKEENNILATRKEETTILATRIEENNILATQKEENNILATQKEENNILATQKEENNILATRIEENNILATRIEENNILATQKEENNILAMQKEENNILAMRKEIKEIYAKNLEEAKKSKNITVIMDDKTLSAALIKLMIQMNTSFYYLKQLRWLYPRYIPLTIISESKLSTKNCVVLPIEMSSQMTQMYKSILADGDRYIEKEKLGRCNVDVVKRTNTRLNSNISDESVALYALLWLQLQITRNSYPDSETIAALLRKHILECDNTKVSNRALNVFKRLISLHPPYNKVMRDYYVNVFNNAVCEEEMCSANGCWGFLRPILKRLPESSCESLVDMILSLLQMDLEYYNTSPMVIEKLVGYRLFWDSSKSQKPSILSKPVKELIELWTQSLNKDVITQRNITSLVSLMLDLVWKDEPTSNISLLVEWPLELSCKDVAGCFFSKFSQLESGTPLIKLLQGIEVPWQKLLLASLAYRSMDPSSSKFKVSLSNIKRSLQREVKYCTSDCQTDMKIPHAAKIQLLAMMFIAFVHYSGVPVVRQHFIKQVKSTLVKKVIPTYHSSPKVQSDSKRSNDENEFPSHDGSSQKSSSCKRKLSDDDQCPTTSDEVEMNQTVAMVPQNVINCVFDAFQQLTKYKDIIFELEKNCPHLAPLNLLSKIK